MSATQSKKLRLGLVIDPEFAMLEKSVCALTPPLIRALCKNFDTRILWNQERYDRFCGEVDFLLSMEPKWAAPVLKWKRWGRLRRSHPSCPTFVIMSDPHIETWREDYFLRNDLGSILALYDQPTRRHFRRVPPGRIVHFPWAIPAAWMDDSPVAYRGQREIAIFGAARSDAYELRNWCREQKGVQSFANSGVENKLLEDREFFEWLKGFDAVIAAGSESPKYRLTTPKYFETAACGSLLFAQQTEDLATLGFEHRRNCLVFNRESFTTISAEYLADPAAESWLKIRRAGRDLIRARHTLEHRITFLEQMVRRETSGSPLDPGGETASKTKAAAS